MASTVKYQAVATKSKRKAKIAQVHLGDFSLEGLVCEDGSTFIAVVQLVSLNLIQPNKSAKQIESLTGLHSLEFVKLSTSLNSKEVNAISISTFRDLLLSLAINGNSSAQKVLKSSGISYVAPRKKMSKSASSKYREKKIQDQLASSLNGKTEVNTLAGRIDILTSTELIEVKQIKSWKSAVGQVIVYGDYYPSHAKRIHLFGETQSSYLAMIVDHCDKREITVTWEA